ncbi:MAG: LysR family transcriptional regulator [Aquabacterium sp.]|nr:MAG: LysR family transcriptional regulator [Aquabacterium sp.]
MSNRPPPLQWLPAFEAAARLQSISAAAAELHLTPSAVSQQVRQLEDHLGMALFRRLPRRIELTDAGHAFAELAARTLAAYREGHAQLLHRFERPLLRIGMFPSVAHEVVLPALAGFQATEPGMDLRFETGTGVVDFDDARLDAAVRFGTGGWPGLEQLPLGDCMGTLVAAPELAQRLPVRGLEDLRHHVLIHPRLSHDDWDAVARAAGVERLPRKGDLMLDDEWAALRAAEQGLGVAICILPVGRRWLDEGSLKALVPAVPLPMKNWFVFRAASAKREELMRVYRWLRARFDELA